MRILTLIHVFLFFQTAIYATEDSPGSKKLKQRPSSIKLVVNENELRIPGATFQLGIEAIMPDGSTLSTKNIGGDLSFRNFTVTVAGGSFHNGNIRVETNLANEELIVTAITRKYDDVTATQKIPLHREMALLVRNVPMGDAAPGEKYCLEMEVVFDNGAKRRIGTRQLPFDNYRIQVNGGEVKRNVVKISEDISTITDHRVSAQITSETNQQLVAESHYPLDYIKSYRFYTSGSRGFSGDDGSMIAAFNKHGGHGRSGGQGPDLQVFVSAFFDELLQQELIYAEVRSRNRSRQYLVNPSGGSLHIASEGGWGGSGGDGGRGRDGEDGRDGRIERYRKRINDSTYQEVEKIYPGEDGRPGEDGGFGGDGGRGGDGGNIYVHFTLAAEKYMDRFYFENDGGSGGWGGSGGVGGDGGDGGDGEPDGRDGADGRRGQDGRRGPDGYRGKVFYRVIFEEEYRGNQ